MLEVRREMTKERKEKESWKVLDVVDNAVERRKGLGRGSRR